MNGQNFKERTNSSDFVEQTTPDEDTPVANSDRYTEEDPVLEADTEHADETIVHEAVPYKAQASETNTESSIALLNPIESEHLRARWNNIQGKFVDEPRSAVQQADALVSDVIEEITRMFAEQHSALEGQWKKDNNVSTEDLRKALQRYRSFFNRLVV
jgi:hypothetical protein